VQRSPVCDLESGPDDPDEALDAGVLSAREWERDVLVRFRALVERVRAGEAAPSPDELATVLAGLRDISLRDAVAMECSAWAWLGPNAGAMANGPVAEPPGRDDPVAAVLIELSTSSDGVWAVAPLTLLAMQLWAAGNGGLANVAVDRALRLDPDYRMARLVDQLLRSGTPPAWADRSRAAAACDAVDHDRLAT